MKPEKIKKLFTRSSVTVNSQVDDKIINDAFQTFEKLQEEISAAAKPNIWRIIMKSKITKLAATVVVVILIISLAVTIMEKSAAPVFADVFDNITKAYTVKYKQTFHPGEEMEFTANYMLMEPAHMRTEMPQMPHGIIMVRDFLKGRSLQLEPQLKKAYILQDTGRNKLPQSYSYIRKVLRIHEREGEFAGNEQINGRMTNIFVIEYPYDTITIWADPQTNLPVRIESTSFPNPEKDIKPPEMFLESTDFGFDANEMRAVGGTITSSRGSPQGITEGMTTVMSDFVWDLELDESLFSLEPPNDYTVEERQSDSSEPSEKHLMEALAFWTKMSQGMFPVVIDELNDPNKVKPLLIKEYNKGGEPKHQFEQALKKMSVIMKGFYFVQTLKVEGNWNYNSVDTYLSDSETPICWWKVEDSNDYRVIYGDLSIGTVTAEQLLE
ncbi:MAG: hypothetical protein ACYTE8_04485 [Planctomycetota bacterium]|jgi:hypothetical protein